MSRGTKTGLSAGADPSVKTKDGWTAMKLAKKRGYPDIMETLKKVEAKD
jgi:ankyrin repeat protein